MNDGSSLPIDEDIGAEARAGILDKLKDDINGFLWTRLPGATPLSRADSISGDIWALITNEWTNAPGAALPTKENHGCAKLLGYVDHEAVHCVRHDEAGKCCALERETPAERKDP